MIIKLIAQEPVAETAAAHVAEVAPAEEEHKGDEATEVLEAPVEVEEPAVEPVEAAAEPVHETVEAPGARHSA